MCIYISARTHTHTHTHTHTRARSRAQIQNTENHEERISRNEESRRHKRMYIRSMNDLNALIKKEDVTLLFFNLIVSHD